MFNPAFIVKAGWWLGLSVILPAVDANPFPQLKVGRRGIVPSRGFSVATVHNSRFKADGPKQYLRSARKYGMQMPLQFTETLSNKGLTGDVIAYNQTDDQEWLSPVEIGNPPQQLLLDLDTGSSDLWVFSSETKTVGATNGTRQIWHPELSTTARRLNGSKWTISYGDGSYAMGGAWTDSVTLAGIAVPNATVESATSVSRAMVVDKVLGGLVGLAYNLTSQVYPATPTLLDQMLPLLDQPLFAVDLHWHTTGLYEFGKITDTAFSGNLSWIPLSPQAEFWEIDFNGFNIGDSIYWLDSVWPVIIDTGTTLMLLQYDLVDAYYKQVPNSLYSGRMGGYIFPCNQTLPDLHVSFGDEGYFVSIPGEYINYSSLVNYGDPVRCYGGIQSNEGLPFAIFGDIFLKSVYTVFDHGNARVGLADKALNWNEGGFKAKKVRPAKTA